MYSDAHRTMTGGMEVDAALQGATSEGTSAKHGSRQRGGQWLGRGWGGGAQRGTADRGEYVHVTPLRTPMLQAGRPDDCVC